MILLRAFLVPQASGWGGGTKVRTAIAAAGWRTTRPAWREPATTAARPRSTKSTATAAAEAAASRTWAAEATTTRARPEASRSWWTGRAILARARFAHGERPALEWLRVKLADNFFGFRAIGKLDECKSAWTTSLAIDRHGDVRRLCDGREVCPKIGLARAVGEVPDEQTDCQGLLVKSPLL